MEVEKALLHQLNAWLSRTDDPILDGVVPAPCGYWEHFCAKSVGPGGLPQEPGREGWLTVRWPSEATQHHCVPSGGKRERNGLGVFQMS